MWQRIAADNGAEAMIELECGEQFFREFFGFVGADGEGVAFGFEAIKNIQQAGEGAALVGDCGRVDVEIFVPPGAEGGIVDVVVEDMQSALQHGLRAVRNQRSGFAFRDSRKAFSHE